MRCYRNLRASASGALEAYAIIGDHLLAFQTGNGVEVKVTLIHMTDSYLASMDAAGWPDHTPITEEQLKEFARPLLDRLKEVMGGHIETNMVRDLRQAQKDYYASRNPNNKQELLKRARALEDMVDKRLKKMEPPAFPLFPPASSTAIQQPTAREDLQDSLRKAIAEVQRLEKAVAAWPTTA